jgi:hypothetical protein
VAGKGETIGPLLRFCAGPVIGRRCHEAFVSGRHYSSVVPARLNTLRAGTLAALLLSFSLHGFILIPVLLGAPMFHAHSPHAAAGFVSTAIILDEPRQAIHAQAEPPIQLQLAQVGLPTELPTSLPTEWPSLPDLPDADADPVYVYIRHMGEITSRIQRAWTLPSGGPMADFHCRVRIRRDLEGSMEDVEFQTCDNDQALRASLLKAVQGAAPLPLSDDEQRAGRGVTLDFVAFAAPSGGHRTSVQPGAAMP